MGVARGLGCLCGKACTSHLCDGSAHSSGCMVTWPFELLLLSLPCKLQTTTLLPKVHTLLEVELAWLHTYIPGNVGVSSMSQE